MISRALPFTKAHAYGNDFLFINEDEGDVKRHAPAGERRALARAICDRHCGIGADGVIFYRLRAGRVTMTLFNADGSSAEVSGNGVRCLAAIAVEAVGATPGGETVIETDGGTKRLDLLEASSPRYTFRAFMGTPERLQQRSLEVAGLPAQGGGPAAEAERIDVVTLSMGNPQCVVLVDTLDREEFERVAPRLATHDAFSDGTNVEFACVEEPDRVRILIWERGVGPTSASGTGACASAVAAAAYGGGARAAHVVSPGGSQYVEWAGDGIYLTGWAEITARGTWLVP